MEQALVECGYPFVSSGKTNVEPSHPQLQALSASVKDVLSIHTASPPEQVPNDASDDAFDDDFEPLIAPLSPLLKPFEVRFLHHFSGKRATNSPEHPEWCLTQVLDWVTSHIPFWDTHIQPHVTVTNLQLVV